MMFLSKFIIKTDSRVIAIILIGPYIDRLCTPSYNWRRAIAALQNNAVLANARICIRAMHFFISSNIARPCLPADDLSCESSSANNFS